jgi:hypothetical protein
VRGITPASSPASAEPSFDVGLGELFVLHQIASFSRRVRGVYPPGVRFHIVIDNLCALLVNDIPAARTEAYCASFRELIEATVTSEVVRLIVEAEHFTIADFCGLTDDPAGGGPAVDARARDHVERLPWPAVQRRGSLGSHAALSPRDREVGGAAGRGDPRRAHDPARHARNDLLPAVPGRRFPHSVRRGRAGQECQGPALSADL